MSVPKKARPILTTTLRGMSAPQWAAVSTTRGVIRLPEQAEKGSPKSAPRETTEGKPASVWPSMTGEARDALGVSRRLAASHEQGKAGRCMPAG